MGLQRKTPLRSNAPLRSKKGLERSGSGLKQGAPLKRTPFPSKKKVPESRSGAPQGKVKQKRPQKQSRPPAMTAEEKRCREVVSRRSEGRCEVCGLTGRALEKAHRLARSQGGGWVASNVLDLCSRCHQWNHAHPAVAYDNGWHLRSHQKHEEEWVLLLPPGRVPLGLFDEESELARRWDPTNPALGLVPALLDDEGNIEWAA